MWAQAWYLPRIRAHGAEFLRYTHITDKRLDVAAIVRDYQRVQAVQLDVPTTNSRAKSTDTPIGRFNAQYGSAEVMGSTLSAADYRFSRSEIINNTMAYRYLAPQSQSGNPGVVLFCARDGTWRVFSFHGDHDPLAETNPATGTPLAHDAFDLFRILYHGGNVKDALRALVPKPIIQVQGGSLKESTEQGIQALGKMDFPIVYQRGSMLVRVAHLPETTEVQGVKVPKGTATLMELKNTALRLQLADAALWQKFSEDRGWYDVNPPPEISQAVLESAGDWYDLPVLLGIAEAPILRPDGSLHDVAGYDPETRLYYEGRAPQLSGRPHPDQAEAKNAAQFLLRPFAEFPFLDGQLDQAVVLAYLFTLALRPLLPLAPLFGFSATTPGTGKGLLAECCNLIVRGRDAAIMPPTGGQGAEEETRKRITALLLQGVASVLLDNWTGAIGGDSFNALLTAASWSDRVLGKSQTVKLPARVTWAATGNNLTVRGDMVRRTLLAVIDARAERPELRKFRIPNLTQHVTEHRHELLSALFTILRAYRQAGEPERDGPVLGRFESWSRSVAAPIRWVGFPDPIQSQERLRADDPEAQKLTALLSAWFEVFGDRTVTVADLVNGAAGAMGSLGAPEEAPKRARLQEALEEVASDRPGQVNRKKLGWYLKHFAGRVCDGKALFVDRSQKDAVRYRVAQAGLAGAAA